MRAESRHVQACCARAVTVMHWFTVAISLAPEVVQLYKIGEHNLVYATRTSQNIE